jgi:predicted lipoprotein with Yx(FWY)xxD motif
MFRSRAATLVASLVIGSLALTACGGDDKNKNSSNGKPSASELITSSGTPEEKEKKGTGDWAISTKGNDASRTSWIRLQKSPAGNVVNGSGRSLYLFKADGRAPSKATCKGPCADKWPPVLVVRGKTRLYPLGIQSQIGVVTREDGTDQLTLNGWPLYRFSGDTKRGDVNGQGVDGKWFVIGADGKEIRNLAGGTGGSTGGGTGGNTGGGAGKPGAATLLSDPNDTSENNAARRVTGTGCVNVGGQNTASAIRDISPAPVKIWSERDCKGRSAVVNGDILDLGTIGFDNDISSIFFG